jgi:hypothetical protein
LRIVSIATAVMPVWRSPMINSRWPRPIGTMPSIDEAGLHRFAHRLAVHDAGRNALIGETCRSGSGLAVDRRPRR